MSLTTSISMLIMKMKMKLIFLGISSATIKMLAYSILFHSLVYLQRKSLVSSFRYHLRCRMGMYVESWADGDSLGSKKIFRNTKLWEFVNCERNTKLYHLKERFI